MGLSVWQIAIIAVVALILFGGGGKLVRLMGDMGSGLRAFKKGIADDSNGGDDEGGEETPKIAEQPEEPKATKTKKTKSKKSKSKKSTAKKSKAKKSKAKKS